jgi:DNA segregation ATPase FtsK/SpoIIIE-like protein
VHHMKRLFGGAAMSLALALAAGAAAPALFQAAAVAQENVSLEVFEAELAPYGEWFDHPRWGRVWAPNDMPQDWRPYTTGRWIWTDEHGWYWQADEEWGWIPFHYGRWAFDRRDGWLWVPGTVWGPAWVSWRETEDAYGWAPLPPEEEEEVAEADPVYWTFVAPRDFSAPRIYAVRLPPARVQVVFPRTRFVYRTTVRDRDNRPRGFNRGPDRVVVERRGNGRVDVRVVEPRFVDREIERRRGPNSAELQRFRERQREEGARIRVRVDEEGVRRAGGPPRGPDNDGGRQGQGDTPRRGNEDATPPGREQQQRQQRQERQEQREQRLERQEQRRERQERQQRREERQPEGRPDRRGPPPEAATGAEQQGGRGQQRPAREETPPPNQDAGRSGTPPDAEQQQNRRRRDNAPESAQPAQQQQQQQQQQRQEPQPREQRQEQQPQRQQRQEQRQEQQQQRQQQQEQRQQRQEERQQRRNPPANCTPGQPGC